MMGKLVTAAAFASVHVYTAELYPSVVRSIGVGVASASSSMGGIMAVELGHRMVGSYSGTCIPVDGPIYL